MNFEEKNENFGHISFKKWEKSLIKQQISIPQLL